MQCSIINHVQLFTTPWTVAYQAPQSMGFSRQNYWSEKKKVLEWVTISFSRGSSQRTDRICVSYIADRCFTVWATWEALEVVTDFILGGLQNHCNYEIKGLLLLERKAMTKLDNILKNKDIICQQSFVQLKLWFFQSSMYGCEVWTIKKVERRRIDAFDCGAGDDSWESLVLQRDQTNQS